MENKYPYIDVDKIQNCLTDSGITARAHYYSSGIDCVVKPKNENNYCYNIAAEKNTQIFCYPIVIVHLLNLSDVSEAIKYGAKNKISIVARAGGHSFESYSIVMKIVFWLFILTTSKIL
ncbi:FAD-binding oxidoreductase [Gigaspora margarita]|uniref:FAD-binding oxidoreductase n=1 Tax=Gigaspora margarita TaxID=4874 RepID=A0A8H4AXB2_GIGMA|nr:FAD-binding oxidoreductase [Gigaspora margarita]